jgi:hypothetical protein
MRRVLLPALAILVFGVTPLTAQSQAKSPTAARIIGIIPGAGHMYAGETGRGFAYLGGIVGVALVGGLVLAVDCTADIYSGSDQCGTSAGEDVLAVAIVGLWGWSIYDAGRAAHRTNAKQGLRASLLIAPQRSRGVAHSGRGVRLGLSVATR